LSKPKAPRVQLLSASGCAHCARTRALLRAQGVPYQELDVGRSAAGAARFRRLGARGVPVLLIGSRRIDGFQPEAIRRALRDAGLAE
jgi:glutaredoxin